MKCIEKSKKFENSSRINFTETQINLNGRSLKYCMKQIFTNRINEILASDADINFQLNTSYNEKANISNLILSLKTIKYNTKNENETKF